MAPYTAITSRHDTSHYQRYWLISYWQARVCLKAPTLYGWQLKQDCGDQNLNLSVEDSSMFSRSLTVEVRNAVRCPSVGTDPARSALGFLPWLAMCVCTRIQSLVCRISKAIEMLLLLLPTERDRKKGFTREYSNYVSCFLVDGDNAALGSEVSVLGLGEGASAAPPLDFLQLLLPPPVILVIVAHDRRQSVLFLSISRLHEHLSPFYYESINQHIDHPNAIASCKTSILFLRFFSAPPGSISSFNHPALDWRQSTAAASSHPPCASTPMKAYPFLLFSLDYQEPNTGGINILDRTIAPARSGTSHPTYGVHLPYKASLRISPSPHQPAPPSSAVAWVVKRTVSLAPSTSKLDVTLGCAVSVKGKAAESTGNYFCALVCLSSAAESGTGRIFRPPRITLACSYNQPRPFRWFERHPSSFS
ncbi:uncharacterized protein CLUP02_05329 [Colletotrichum lupini]|uniref:Uncharacterized protein n=1 Tax=Colletotrichum lupini TaxID=145971 RepID=A0A9Q8SLZ5_9PEZI|nr:uncharacterized protein CLUP02_05329 [Colletotrichum lupini]UQC79849.1 hypothetical protein CLUP02_05329 [Colletotrichum lupini]